MILELFAICNVGVNQDVPILGCLRFRARVAFIKLAYIVINLAENYVDDWIEIR
jgi:hypothetical protein